MCSRGTLNLTIILRNPSPLLLNVSISVLDGVPSVFTGRQGKECLPRLESPDINGINPVSNWFPYTCCDRLHVMLSKWMKLATDQVIGPPDMFGISILRLKFQKIKEQIGNFFSTSNSNCSFFTFEVVRVANQFDVCSHTRSVDTFGQSQTP